MRHLISFNESVLDRIKSTIKDILVELEDIGFTVEIYQSGANETLSISITNKNNAINIVDYTSLFEMLFSYLEHNYELYLIRWEEELIFKNDSNYELSETDVDNEYATFYEVLKNRDLYNLVLFFNPTLINKFSKWQG